MSVRIMTRVWDHFPGSGSKLLVMLAFADWSDDDGGNIYPSILKAANKVRLTTCQARRVIHQLIDDGWIQVIANPHGGAPGSTRHYRINLEKLGDTPSAGASPTASASARGSTDARASTSAREGSHPCAQTASAGASLSINEPSLTVTSSSSGDEVAVSKESYTTKRKRKLTGWKLESFNQFWEVFAYKSGRAEAADAWLDIPGLTSNLVKNEILPAAAKEAQRRPEIRKNNGIPKMAQGWLSGRRWEDDVEQPPEQPTATDGYKLAKRQELAV